MRVASVPKEKVWLSANGRVYDIKHAAKLTGTTVAKLRAMLLQGALTDPGDKRESIAETDVLRLRAERGRLQIETDRRAKAATNRPKPKDVGRPVVRLRERAADQAVLNWSRFSGPAEPSRESGRSIMPPA